MRSDQACVIADKRIGKGTEIPNMDLCNLYGDFCIGEDCKIGAFVEIGPGVRIGDRCIISAFAFIPSGVIIGNDVFIGPRATFCNDKYPPSAGAWRQAPPTVVRDFAVIGANATILPSIEIGVNAMVGAGAVVLGDVPPNWVVAGNPARRMNHTKEI